MHCAGLSSVPSVGAIKGFPWFRSVLGSPESNVWVGGKPGARAVRTRGCWLPAGEGARLLLEAPAMSKNRKGGNGRKPVVLGGLCLCFFFSSYGNHCWHGLKLKCWEGMGWVQEHERRALLGLSPRHAGPGWKENRGGKWILGGGCAPPRLTLLSPAAQGCPSGLALRAEGPGVHGRGESRGGTPSSSHVWQMGGRSIR